jgi:hypothetical protein
LVKSFNLNLVAIDYSINSPGICLLKDGNPHYISYIKPKSGTKKEQKLQEEMNLLNDVTLINQPEPNVDKQELTRVMRHRTIAEGICELIAEHTNTDEEYKIYFEGSSYGTSRFGTNSLIDLASASSILKSYLIDRFNVTVLEVYAPTTIKKHAGKGNMKKMEMWEKYINDESNRESGLWNFCQQFKEDKKIMKPLDDLVDAYFIMSYVRSL